MEYEEKEVYLYLDFKGVLPPTTFKRNKMFFKMINLDTDTPLVQLDDILYKGKYSDAVGTNAFFEEVEETTGETLSKPTPIHLKHLLNQTKLLELERVRLPDNMVPVDKNDCVKVKFDCDYKQVLDKLSNGTFRIDDYIIQKPQSESEEEAETSTKVEEKDSPVHDETPKEMDTNQLTDTLIENEPDITNIDSSTTIEQMEMETIENKEEDDADYIRSLNVLKKIADEPLHIQKEQDNVQIAPDLQFNINLLPYASIDLLLQSMSLEEMTFKNNTDSFYGLFNSMAIIKQGALMPFHKISDVNELLSINNFENLGIIGKLYVLMQYLRAEERHLKELSKEELSKFDSFGYTPLQRHELLKSFAIRTVYIISKKIKTYYLRKV